MLTKNQKTELLQSWKNQRALNLSLTIKGSLHCDEPADVLKEKLDRARFANIESKNKTQEKGGEPSALPPAVAASAEDFVEVTYRALSAAVLADRPIDFSNEKMLKRATRLLKNQTVFKDHDTSVDNWVGQVEDSLWDDQTKGIPPGINAILKLDIVKDPMTVRGVLQGVIHSASVTVSFEWKPSHPKLMDDGTFFEKMGDEIDGELVRIIVTKIDRFLEISLVWQGADEYAKQIGPNGKPVSQFFETDPQRDVGRLSYNSSKQISKEEEMEELKTLLKQTFGLEINADNFTKTLAQYVEQAKSAIGEKYDAQVSKLTSQLDEASKTIVELETEVKEMKPKAELGSKYLEDERAEAIRLCKLVKGENINDAILKTLENGDLALVQAWKEEFRKEAELKFPNKCAKCGSTEITRQSSNPAKDKEENKSSVLSKPTSDYVRDLHTL